jgi:hypothetical protein
VGACCPARAAALSQSQSAGGLRGLLSTSYPECMDALWEIKDYEFDMIVGSLSISMYP